MRTWLVAIVGFGLIGCATSRGTVAVQKPDEKRDSAVVEAPKPVENVPSVKLGARRPPHYKVVGRREATPKTTDFIERRRKSGFQWSRPVCRVNAAGTVKMRAPPRLSAR